MVDSQVYIVEMQPELPNWGTHLCCPTYGVPLLATILRKRGVNAEALVEGVSQFQLADLLQADVICFSVMTCSAKKTYALADELRRNGKLVVFGGTHATYFPRSCLNHSDYVVRGEGDVILPSLVTALRDHTAVCDIPGISYRAGGTIVSTRIPPVPEDLSTVADWATIRGFCDPHARKRFVRYQVPVQTSRGCRHSCSFCVAATMFGGCYRKRPIPSVLEEIRNAASISSRIMFVDNDFVGATHNDRAHTRELCKRISGLRLSLDIAAYTTVSVARYPQLLRQMYSAGIRTLCLGLESLNEHSLREYKKHQTVGDIPVAVKQLTEFGLTVSASFMVGIDGEDSKSVLQIAEVARRWGLHAIYFFVLSPYPNMTELVPANRIFLTEWKFGTGHFVYFLPASDPPSALQTAMIKATRQFYSYPRIMSLFLRLRWRQATQTLVRRLAFRPIGKAMEAYVSLLTTLERPFYAANGELDPVALQRGCSRILDWDNELTIEEVTP